MIRKITKDRPLKILGFTDTHLDHNEGPYHLTMKLIRETIQGESPDLVVYVGDNVTSGYNKERLAEFTQMMTELKIPWCWETMRRIILILKEEAKWCVYSVPRPIA